MNVESGIFNDAKILEITKQSMFRIGTKDIFKNFSESLQCMGKVGQTEFTSQTVVRNQIVHGDHRGFAAIEQYGCFDISSVACLYKKK